MKTLPERSRRRLVLLTQLLSQLERDTITSLEIEKLTGWSNSVIRRDISMIGCICGASNGYHVDVLLKMLKKAIGEDGSHEKKCCLVGLGKIGESLCTGDMLEDSSFKLVAGFDESVNKTEVIKASCPLYPTTKLEDVIKAQGIRYAILAVPDSEAQQTAKRLIECGIRGIVNYTSTVLIVDEGVAVENVAVRTALNVLAAAIEE